MTDLSCSFCHLSRTSVEMLVAGNSGNICDTCLANSTEFNASSEPPCVLCDTATAKFGLSDMLVGVCADCAVSSKNIFEKLSPGQTWIARTNKTPRSCRRPYSDEEEQQNFYDSVLNQLSKEPITENTGDTLVNLFEIEPSIELVDYARKWIQQFPNHPQAPDLLSFWLKQFPSKESVELRARYLERHEPLKELHWLILSVKQVKSFSRLDQLVFDRLERAPQDIIWSRCLSPYESRSRFANKLARRWLKLNEDNPHLLIMGYTFFANSPDIVAAIFNHLRKHGFAFAPNAWELQALLDKAHEFKMSILPSVIKFVRA